MSQYGNDVTRQHNKSYGRLFGLTETGNHWAFGGFITGRLEHVNDDDIFILQSISGGCKVLFNCGLFEEDYKIFVERNSDNLAVDFKVPSREFFTQPGHHTIWIGKLTLNHSRQGASLIDSCEVDYYGPCVVPFVNCDLSLKYAVATGWLTIDGHYIGWRDPSLLYVSLPVGNIYVKLTEMDPSWLQDKPIWFSHHLTCHFHEERQLVVPSEQNRVEARLCACFGNEEEVVFSSECVIT